MNIEQFTDGNMTEICKKHEKKEGIIHCTNCNRKYQYILAEVVNDEASTTTVENFINPYTTTLKMISHSDKEELECGNCHMSFDIINMGQEEENCSTHTCIVNCHYTKLTIVGCGNNCTDCKGYADWYRDRDGYTRCSDCNEKWNCEDECSCFQSCERKY